MRNRGLPPPGAIVVGVHDGSSGRGAVLWAARAARNRRRSLVVCHAYQPRGRTGRELECAARNRAWRTAEDSERAARTEVPGVEVMSWVAAGTPSEVIANAVEEPELIVVGFRTHGRLAGDLLASLWARADVVPICPVVAVPSGTGVLRRSAAKGRRRRDQRGLGGRVVVAVTGGSDAEVLRFAAAEAARSGADLREVNGHVTTAAGYDIGEPLATLARHADLLVVGKPVTSGSTRPSMIANGWVPQVESPPIASLGAALGYGAIRRLSAPIAVVPAALRPGMMVPAGVPDAVRPSADIPTEPAAEGVAWLPTPRRPGDELPATPVARR
jgi:nucleotide-binding universal stress UspA family protein